MIDIDILKRCRRVIIDSIKKEERAYQLDGLKETLRRIEDKIKNHGKEEKDNRPTT